MKKKILIFTIVFCSFLSSCSYLTYIFCGSFNFVLTEEEINKKVFECTKDFKQSKYGFEWTIPIIKIYLIEDSDRAEIYITLSGENRIIPRVQCDIMATATIDYRSNDCSIFLAKTKLESSTCRTTLIDFIPDRLAEWVINEKIIPSVQSHPFKIDNYGCDKFYVDTIICKDKKANITLKKVK